MMILNSYRFAGVGVQTPFEYFGADLAFQWDRVFPDPVNASGTYKQITRGSLTNAQDSMSPFNKGVDFAALSLKKEYDFSVNADGFLASTGVSSSTGAETVNGRNNCLKSVIDGTTGSHKFQHLSGVGGIYDTVITGEYYIPASQTALEGVRIASLYYGDDCFLSTKGAWTPFTLMFGNLDYPHLFMDTVDSSLNTSYTGNVGEYIAFSSLKIEHIVKPVFAETSNAKMPHLNLTTGKVLFDGVDDEWNIRQFDGSALTGWTLAYRGADNDGNGTQRSIFWYYVTANDQLDIEITAGNVFKISVTVASVLTTYTGVTTLSVTGSDQNFAIVWDGDKFHIYIGGVLHETIGSGISTIFAPSPDIVNSGLFTNNLRYAIELSGLMLLDKEASLSDIEFIDSHHSSV